MDIELLVTTGCPNAARADELIATAVTDIQVRATVIRTVITSPGQARRRGFVGSPTILLNGSDPFARHDAPPALACRPYSTPDGLRGVPARTDLRQAITRAERT